MSRELRVIPPFYVPPGLQTVLAQAMFHFGDRACPVGDRIVLDRDEFAGRDARIIWAPDHDRFRRSLERGLDELGLASADTVLLVHVQTRYLGLVSVALRLHLDDIKALDPETPLESAALRSAQNRGARIRVFLLLKHEIPQQQLRPWRKGTCLARAEFVVDTDWFGHLFNPKALDAETRRELDLPDTAMRYLRMGDHDPLVPIRDTEDPDFYVDEDLLNRIHHWGGSPMAHAAQLQLVQDFRHGHRSTWIREAAVGRRGTRMGGCQGLPPGPNAHRRRGERRRSGGTPRGNSRRSEQSASSVRASDRP